jgi:hypothetical protein
MSAADLQVKIILEGETKGAVRILSLREIFCECKTPSAVKQRQREAIIFLLNAVDKRAARALADVYRLEAENKIDPASGTVLVCDFREKAAPTHN